MRGKDLKITFLPNSIEFTSEAGKTVLDYAAEIGIAIDGNCAGAGTCGKCKVRIISGNDGNSDDAEKIKLSAGEIENGYRLACRFRPTENAVVEVPSIEDATNRKTKLIAMPKDFIPTKHFGKEYINIEQATIKNQTADLEKIVISCGLEGRTRINAKLIKRIPDLLKISRELTVTFREEEIIDIELGDTRESCFGLAFDIGTTTVVGLLWNMITGECIGAKAITNPQGIYGADVISRITYADESKENLENIHQKIIDCMNGITADFSVTYNIRPEHIYDITVVGNTTMSHLFLNVNPRQLAVSPFTPVFCNGVSDFASGLRVKANENAKFYLLPNIAGHVGSDITAGILATGMIHEEGIHLMLDVGTNGEIVLTGKGMAMACSTAAGPAFEGASIYQGVRAAAGAIEKVKIEEDVHITVIGDAAPIGICGSGIIDAVAQMICNGLVDKTGKFTKLDVLEENKTSEAVISRFRKGENGNEFVLAYNTDCDDIVITQKDIREVQLAKAAIFAGIKIMMNKMSASDHDIKKIYIAGAFGNYIDIDSALTIGLLPNIERDKIASVGNAAGIGACMALLSIEKRKEAEKTAIKITHVELAVCEEFQDEYLKAMKF